MFLRQLVLSLSPVPEEYTPGSVMDWLTSDIAVTVTLSQMDT